MRAYADVGDGQLSGHNCSWARVATTSTYIQTTAQISAGSSGGGLFDKHGNLIGITTFKVAGEGLNFAIPADAFVDFSPTSPPRPPPSP